MTSIITYLTTIRFGEGAMADHFCATNPKPLTEDTIEGLIDAAW